MKRFVVGVDASESARVALEWAVSLATTAGAEIVAVHAFQPPYAELNPDDRDELVSERRGLLDGAWSEPARRAGVPVRTIVAEGDPRSVLLDTAASEQADLVVLGRAGPGGRPGFMHLGSVAEHCAHHSDRPLAVIPLDATGPIRHLVVGADGSAESFNAARWSGQLGDVMRASVVAVVSEDHESNAVHLSQLTLEWARPLAALHISVTPIVRNHIDAADGLLDAAADLDADAVVVGTRGAGGFTGLRIGGVAIATLHRATIPVILVPPPPQDEP